MELYVQMLDPRVNCDGLLWGSGELGFTYLRVRMRGNPSKQRRWVMTRAFVVVCPVIWVGAACLGCICCTGEMCWSLLLGQVFLNLGSGNFKFHNEMSRQSSA